MAITTITNSMVSVNAIQGTLIADNAITAVHIASNAVASIQIAENNVTAREIAANTITVAQLADDCVESDKIADGVITTNHLNKAMISSQTEVAVATGDFILLGDTSDSNNLKKAPISSILAGTLTTAAQTNITSLGTLTALTGGTGDLVWDSPTFAVDSSENRVGIGTTSPADKLHVALDSSTTNAEVDVVRIEATSSGTPAVGFGPFIDFRGDRINGGADSYGRLGFEADSMPSTTVDGAFVVQTAEDGTYSERLRIASDGKVGIGTDSPLDALHITSAVSTDYRGNLLLSDSTAIATGVGGQITFGGKYTGSTYTEWAGIQGTKENATDGQYGGQLEFKTRAHNASLSTKMTLDSSGNVGIGTTDFNNMGSSSYKGLKVGGATLQDSGGGNGSATWLGNNAYVGSGNNFYFDAGGKASGMQLTSGDINFFTFDGSGGSADAQWSNTSRLHISETGLVGIGTTGPARPLHVKSTGTNMASFEGSNGEGIVIVNNTNGRADIIGYSDTAGAYNPLVLRAQGSYDQLYLDTSGNVGIQCDPNANLEVFDASGGAGTGLRLNCNNGGSDVWDLYSTTAGRIYITNPNYNGGVYLQHTHTSWTGVSDENLKENITSLGTVGDKLKNYRTSYFNWKADNRETPKRQIGFIAQDWETDFPEVVNKMEGEPLGMQYTETIPILLKYIQELEARIETLEG